jgi:glucose-1-phosphate adenylyltransferase
MGTVIRPFPGVEEYDNDLYSVRDGIVVVPKGTVIPPGTRIAPD